MGCCCIGLYIILALVVALLLSCLRWALQGLKAKRVKYAGKGVLISGGSQGLGLSIASEFVKEGANVCILARNPEKLAQAEAQLKALGKGRVLSLPCDVTNESQVQAATQRMVEWAGAVDVVVANAGQAFIGHFVDLPTEAFRQSFDVNYMGTVHLLKHTIPRMVEQRRGSVLIVSSALGLSAFSGYAPYAPTKYALRGLADCLRNELLGSNVDVTIYYPSNIDTPGLVIENQNKPAETKEMDGTASTLCPDKCARDCLRALKRKQFQLTSNFEIEMLRVTANGVAPRSLPFLVENIIFMPVVGYVGEMIRRGWDRIARKHARAH